MGRETLWKLHGEGRDVNMYVCNHFNFTFEVSLKLELWCIGPLKTSHSRQPNPHMSRDLINNNNNIYN